MSSTQFQLHDLSCVQNVQTDDWPLCAPTIDQIWPPFKCLDSPETIEAFGQECIKIPDSYGKFEDLDDASNSDNGGTIDEMSNGAMNFQDFKNMDSCLISDARNEAKNFQILSLPAALSVENITCVSTTSESFSIASIGAAAIDSNRSIDNCGSDVDTKIRSDILDGLDICEILPRSPREPMPMSVVSTTVFVDDSESAHSDALHTSIRETVFTVS
jgi:hypothetical protein